MRYNASFVQESSPKPWLKASSLLLMATVSFACYGVGLGKLTVNSYLNQPMNAQIRLLNIGSIPLSGIKVKIADTNEFARVGMERAYVLGKLSFNVIRNKKHQPVIKITSQQRIDEPFIQFLLDVAWANGQFYRQYTVLLDPPGYIAAEEPPKPKPYRVKSSLRQGTSVMDKQIDAAIVVPDEQLQTATQVTLYGPVRANEDIWQIARRYKSPDATIQQTILAIVGTNSSAFSQGNLNGLKTGVKLSIPSRQIIARVSSEKAPLEIMAHDAAWRDKKPITHVLQPPYTGNIESSKSQLKPYTSKDDVIQQSEPKTQVQAQSVVVNPAQKIKPRKAPKQQSIFDDVLSFSGGLLDTQPLQQVNPQKEIVETSQNKEQVATNNLKASVAVIQSLEKANSLLSQQLNELKKQNKLLTKRVAEQDIEMQQLRKQLADFQLKAKEILTRASVAGQQSEAGSSSLSLGYYLLLAALLFIGLVGAGLGYFYYRQQQQQPEAELEEPTLHLPEDDSQDNNDLLAVPPSQIDEDEEDEQERDDDRDGEEEAFIDIDDKPKIHPAIETQEPSQSTVVETYVEKEPEVEFDADSETKSKMQEAASKPSPEQLAKMVEAHRHQEKEEQELEQADREDDGLTISQPQPLQPEQSDELNQAEKESVDSEDENQKESEEDFILEFEDGLSKELTAEKESEEPQQQESEQEDEFTLEFEPTSVEGIQADQDEDLQDEGGDESGTEGAAGTVDSSSQAQDDSPDEIQEFTLELSDDQSAKSNDADSEIVEDFAEKNPKELSADDFLNDYLSEKSSSNQVEDKGNQSLQQAAVPEKSETKDDTPSNVDDVKMDIDQKVKSLKSPQALDTLLSLAETYMAMEDWQSAKQSLEDVVECGTKEQKQKAQELMKKLDGKD